MQRGLKTLANHLGDEIIKGKLLFLEAFSLLPDVKLLKNTHEYREIFNYFVSMGRASGQI